MNQNYTPEERRRLITALQDGVERIQCPACGSPIRRLPVPAPPGVSYVRHRIWLVCSGCKRSVTTDLPSGR